MKTTIKFFAVITACVFFASCQQEDIQPQPTPVYKEFSVSGNTITGKGDQFGKEKAEAHEESKE